MQLIKNNNQEANKTSLFLQQSLCHTDRFYRIKASASFNYLLVFEDNFFSGFPIPSVSL